MATPIGGGRPGAAVKVDPGLGTAVHPLVGGGWLSAPAGLCEAAGDPPVLLRTGTGVAGLGAVEKVLLILDAIGPGEELTLAEVCRRARMAKSTAHRLLATLVRFGLLDRRAARYTVGPRLRRLAGAVPVPSEEAIREVARPYLQDLYAQTRATVQVSVLRGDAVLCLETVHGHRPAPAPLRTGWQGPLTGNAAGAVLAAFTAPGRPGNRDRFPAGALDRIRAAGLADAALPAHSGVACLAAPVLDAERSALAALSISFRTAGTDAQAMQAALRRVAYSASAALRCLPC